MSPTLDRLSSLLTTGFGFVLLSFLAPFLLLLFFLLPVLVVVVVPSLFDKSRGFVVGFFKDLLDGNVLGFKLVWWTVRQCRCNKSLLTNELVQCKQWNGFSLVCDLSCRCLCSDRVKALAQKAQMYFFCAAIVDQRMIVDVELKMDKQYLWKIKRGETQLIRNEF